MFHITFQILQSSCKVTTSSLGEMGVTTAPFPSNVEKKAKDGLVRCSKSAKGSWYLVIFFRWKKKSCWEKLTVTSVAFNLGTLFSNVNIVNFNAGKKKNIADLFWGGTIQVP